MTWDDGEPTLGRVFTSKLEELLGPARLPEQKVEAKHEDIAASLQVVYEEAAFHVLNELQRSTGLKRLCIAGGCAMAAQIGFWVLLPLRVRHEAPPPAE